MKKLALTFALASISLSSVASDIQAGKAKAVTCAACHGQNGISSIDIYPNLAGQKAAYLVKQLKDFKSGKRQDPVMAPMAMMLNDQDMINVAAYYASLKSN